MMLPLYIFTDQARKYTACLTKHDSGMFGHKANENRNSSWKRGLRLTQRTVNVSSSLVIGMHHRSDGPDYGIVLKDTYVCQRGQRVHKLTRWRNRLRADFLHPAWIVKGQWEEAFSKRKKLNYSEVCTMEGIGNVKAAVTYMSLVHIWAHVTLQTHNQLLVRIMGDQSHIFKAPLNL